jgi:aspartate/methionine/tyrosine aminotransferase
MSKPLTDPPPAPAPNPKDELINAVRHYVHFDNLAETLTKQVTNARSMRADFETKVITMLEAQGMKNAVLQINGATLQRQTRFQSTNLSWSFLEEQLHEYYKSKGRPDETPAIMDFIQKRRGGKSVDYLKKTLPTTGGAGSGGRT